MEKEEQKLAKRDHMAEVQETCASGARRSIKAQRFDLICPVGLRRIAERYKLGSDKYSDYNWCQGLPNPSTVNHLICHVIDFLQNGNTKDDNLAAIAWNAIALMHFEEDCKHHEAEWRKK